MVPRWNLLRAGLVGFGGVVIGTLVIGTLLGGCATGTSAQGEPPAPSGRAEAALVGVCTDTCYERDQNRVVQEEIIRRQCEFACRSQLRWPLVRDRDDVEDRMGSYVRLQGLLTEKTGKPALELAGGVVVMLRVGPDTAGDLPMEGLVAASGRLEADTSLTTHNVVGLE